MNLTEEQLRVVQGALRVAIDIYQKSAETAWETPRIAQAFWTQQIQADLLLSTIEARIG
jgi:hypothetical protein